MTGEVKESKVGGSEQASKEVHTSAEANKAAKTKKGRVAPPTTK